MRVNIVNVEVTVGKAGPRGWSAATVTYTEGGREKQQKVMSFSNPAVFSDVQKLVGEEVDVEVGKNDKGYNEWRSVRRAEGAAPAVKAASSTSDFAAKDAARQVLIVRQSSLKEAVALAIHNDDSDIDNIFRVAQLMVDWVFDSPTDEPDFPDVPI